MKAMKKLLKTIETANLPEYVIEQLSDNPHLLTGLKRMCKPPHLKKGDNPKDTKTKYGLLYVSFNNAKKKLKLPNYDGRYEFIEHYMSDKKFVKLFKDYKKSGYDIQLRPSLHMMSTVVEFPMADFNLEWMTYNKVMTKVNLGNAIKVIEYRGGKPYKVHDSIRKASESNGSSVSTIRYHMKKYKGAFRHATDEDIYYITEERAKVKAEVKKDKNKMGVKI